jgi:quinol-cytochrome oxidoreductase complex cytochrome b subunit
MELEELKTWLNHNIQFLERKVKYMKEHVPDHRNIRYFVGQLEMAQTIYKKLTHE